MRNDEFDAAAARQPQMRVDVDRVTAAGRSRLRQRRAAGLGGGLMGVAAVVTVVVLGPWQGGPGQDTEDAELVPAGGQDQQTSAPVSGEIREVLPLSSAGSAGSGDPVSLEVVRAPGAVKFEVSADLGKESTVGADRGADVVGLPDVQVFVLEPEVGLTVAIWPMRAESTDETLLHAGPSSNGGQFEAQGERFGWSAIEGEAGAELIDDVLIGTGEELTLASGATVEQQWFEAEGRQLRLFLLAEHDLWGVQQVDEEMRVGAQVRREIEVGEASSWSATDSSGEAISQTLALLPPEAGDVRFTDEATGAEQEPTSDVRLGDWRVVAVTRVEQAPAPGAESELIRGTFTWTDAQGREQSSSTDQTP